MARKLPWAASTSAHNPKPSTSSSRTPRPLKQAKPAPRIKHEPAERNSSPSNSSPAKQNCAPQSPHDPSHSRSHDAESLSKPPTLGPPPVEFMRPGLDEDDIYMLVEDEFQDIAQSYTAHLHHAEYERVTKLNGERKAEQQRAGLDFLGGKGIPKNVSEETKQRLKRGLLEERQDGGLKSISGIGLTNDGSDEDSEEAREAVLAREERKVGDMWAGTALSGLMDRDHSQGKTSLKGLEKISGETRASKGFGPNGKRNEQQNTGQEGQIRQKQSKPDKKQEAIRSFERNRTREPATTETKPTGNIAPTSEQPPVAIPHMKLDVKQSNVRDDTGSSAQHETKKIKVESRPASVGRTRKRVSFDDGWDEKAFDATQAASKAASPENSRPKMPNATGREKREREKKERLDAVPAFLIE